MKIVPMDIIKSMSGKVCKHSDISIALNSSSGKMHTSKLCNPYTGPASTKQLAQQSKFKTRAQKATEWLNTNKEKRNAEGTVTQQASALYKEALQLKKALGLSNIRQVICLYMDKTSNTIKLPSQGGTMNGGTSGGGTSSGGSSGSDTNDQGDSYGS